MLAAGLVMTQTPSVPSRLLGKASPLKTLVVAMTIRVSTVSRLNRLAAPLAAATAATTIPTTYRNVTDDDIDGSYRKDFPLLQRLSIPPFAIPSFGSVIARDVLIRRRSCE